MADSGGIDRRTLIKASAVAGAVAWTAPMIVDSLSSPAAAGSQQCTFKCSAVYVFYNDAGTIRYTAFQNGQTGCNHCKSGTIGFCQTCGTGASAISFYGGSVSGGACGSLQNLYYVNAASCPASPPTGMTQVQPDASCASHVTLSGDGHTLSPAGGVTLLGAYAFTGGSWFGACPAIDGTIGFPGCGDPC